MLKNLKGKYISGLKISLLYFFTDWEQIPEGYLRNSPEGFLRDSPEGFLRDSL
jgi:hypothetical protein